MFFLCVFDSYTQYVKQKISLKKDKQKESTTTRFELARAEPIGFQNQLLNHSDTLSEYTPEHEKYITSTKEVEDGMSIPNKRKVQQNKKLEVRSSLPVSLPPTNQYWKIGDIPLLHMHRKKNSGRWGFRSPCLPIANRPLYQVS